MTVPTTGSPDFQTPLPWKSLNVFGSQLRSWPNGASSTAVFPTLAFAAVQLYFAIQTSGDTGALTINWWADSAGTQSLGSDSWGVSFFHYLKVTLPAEAPYFSVTFTNASGHASNVINYAFLSNVPVARPTYPVTGSIAAQIGVSVAISSSIFDNIRFYTKGRGHLRLNPTTASGKLQAILSTADINGNQVSILYLNNGFTTEQHFDFPYPDLRVNLEIDNLDTVAAHSLDYSLWVSDDD